MVNLKNILLFVSMFKYVIMKKTIRQEKKLSLKKTQLMKINDMKVITGGGGSIEMNFNTGGDEPPTLIPQGPKTISVR